MLKQGPEIQEKCASQVTYDLDSMRHQSLCNLLLTEEFRLTFQ